MNANNEHEFKPISKSMRSITINASFTDPNGNYRYRSKCLRKVTSHTVKFVQMDEQNNKIHCRHGRRNHLEDQVYNRLINKEKTNLKKFVNSEINDHFN
jgi:hypothetical protein